VVVAAGVDSHQPEEHIRICEKMFFFVAQEHPITTACNFTLNDKRFRSFFSFSPFGVVSTFY
jgi:hypothetical protein